MPAIVKFLIDPARNRESSAERTGRNDKTVVHAAVVGRLRPARSADDPIVRRHHGDLLRRVASGRRVKSVSGNIRLVGRSAFVHVPYACKVAPGVGRRDGGSGRCAPIGVKGHAVLEERHLHPHERFAIGIPCVDFRGKHGAVRVCEDKIRATRHEVGIAEAVNPLRKPHQRGEVPDGSAARNRGGGRRNLDELRE